MKLIPTEFEPTMRRSTRLAGLSAIALFVAFFLSNERAYADVTIGRPNVLFIAVDDLNDWVGCLGGHAQAKTPNIDGLAKKGVLFEQAYCAAPLCHPSRTAIMTGLRPSTTGIYGNLNWYRDLPKLKDWVTIPQYFRKHGYTAWTGGKIYHQAHGKWSDPEAWDRQYSTKTGTVFPPDGDRYRHGMRDAFTNRILARLMDWSPIEQSTEETADWKTAEGAAIFLKRQHDKPFFLACGIYRPHLQWYAPGKLPSGAPANGQTCKNPVSLVDLYPTLIELCGLPRRSGLEGRSLVPLVNNPNANWPWPAIITHSPRWHGTNHAIRTREFHYIHYSDGKEELYDAQADRHQWKNLADDAGFAVVKANLKKWRPKTNAEHFRGNAAGNRSEAGEKRPGKYVDINKELSR